MDRSNLFIGAGVLVGLGTLAYWFLSREESAAGGGAGTGAGAGGGAGGGASASGGGGTASQAPSQATVQTDYRTDPQKARDEYIEKNTKYTAILYE